MFVYIYQFSVAASREYHTLGDISDKILLPGLKGHMGGINVSWPQIKITWVGIVTKEVCPMLWLLLEDPPDRGWYLLTASYGKEVPEGGSWNLSLAWPSLFESFWFVVLLIPSLRVAFLAFHQGINLQLSQNFHGFWSPIRTVERIFPVDWVIAFPAPWDSSSGILRMLRTPVCSESQVCLLCCYCFKAYLRTPVLLLPPTLGMVPLGNPY